MPKSDQRDAAFNILKADPSRSNRSVGRELGISEHTVAAVRAGLNGGGEDMQTGPVVKMVTVRQCSFEGLQGRVTTSADLIEEYAEAYKRGDDMPPIDAVFDGVKFWVWDGITRTFGAMRAGMEEIKARVTRGTYQDAWLKSRGANSNHGQKRSREDVKNVVLSFFEHPEYGRPESEGGWTDRKIANYCNVNQTTVSRYRQEFHNPQTTVGGVMQCITPPAQGSASGCGPQTAEADAPAVVDEGPAAGDSGPDDAPAPAEAPGYKGLQSSAKEKALTAIRTLTQALDSLKLYDSVKVALQRVKDAVDRA